MRALVLLLCAGCSATDPCAGHDGTCIGVEVRGSGSVDQLEVNVVGAAQLDERTPHQPAAAHPLPVTTAVFLPSVGGAVDLEVTGFLAGASVGRGLTTVLLQPGAHRSAVITLTVTNDLGMPTDLSVPNDLSSENFGNRDLSTADFSAGDFAQPDLNSRDFQTKPPRYVFLLSSRASDIGAIGGLDDECTNTAAGAGLPSVSYKALVAYTNLDPANHITLGQGRDILLPSGTKVATDSTFWSVSHLHGIDQLADTTEVVAGCAWANFGPTGNRIPVNNDCGDWTLPDNMHNGAWGDVKAIDASWAISSVDACDAKTCHVYCIQQD